MKVVVRDLISKAGHIASNQREQEGGTSGVECKFSGGTQPLVRDGLTEFAAEGFAQRRRSNGQKKGSKNTSNRWFEFGL
ncbi:hypothetical protein EUGRSUZ_A01893 [Eucalyptus grandis]|uniref:Uncharacterized protein n=2 Tax=Eucalyptus grandis TaxID=71139 RepID=A0ACC3M4N3_EUCGR|nr:hypothetical protein EUGRSUZ_A01893 [Eucalyptus grandis]